MASIVLRSATTLCIVFNVLIPHARTNTPNFKQTIKDGFTNTDSVQFRYHEDCDIAVLSEHRPIENTLTVTQEGHAENITLRFVAFGKKFVVHLQLTRDLFGDTYTRKTVHRHGEDFKAPMHRKEHCYYQGHVHDKPSSLAALSSCEGFRGYIFDGHEAYYIEPVNSTQHRVSRQSDLTPSHFKCGTQKRDVYYTPSFTFKKHRRRKRGIRGPYDMDKKTRFVQLYLVNDHRTFERYGKNDTVVFRRSQDIANIVNSLYRQLHIYVVLVGVEVWGGRDKIPISSNADVTMEKFLRYRMERINPYHPNDNSQLITGIVFDHGVVGKALKGPICTHQYSGGVSMDHQGPVSLVATTVAHEMGHNFGMEHDNETTCSCPQDKCIMAPTSGHFSPRYWSSCSQNSLVEAFELGMDYCLRDLPPSVYDGPVCGNGLVEDGEDCDCGLLEDCTDRCCNATSCQLHSLAECGTGQCCDLTSCKLKAASALCREARGECDLPEYCNGTSEFCPDDVFLQTGVSCSEGQSYCYKGGCHTHTGQCQLLWGDTGRVSDPLCFQHLNQRGNRDGNCGYNWTTERYSTCDTENVMCGLLHCVHLNEKLMFWRDSLALDMRANFLSRGNTQYVCRSTMLDVGLDMPDPGLAPDGAKCEEDKICIKQTCTPLMKLSIPACPDCHGNGVCNSNGNCHCDVGYKPPLCDQSGFGGSIDSGPAADTYAKDHLLVTLLVLFLLVLPLLVLAVFIYIKRRQIITCLKRQPRAKLGSGKLPPRPSQPPRPRPSSGVSQKRWSAASNRTNGRLEISGPLLDDQSASDGTVHTSPGPPPRPSGPPRPVYKPSAHKAPARPTVGFTPLPQVPSGESSGAKAGKTTAGQLNGGKAGKSITGESSGAKAGKSITGEMSGSKAGKSIIGEMSGSKVGKNSTGFGQVMSQSDVKRPAAVSEHSSPSPISLSVSKVSDSKAQSVRDIKKPIDRPAQSVRDIKKPTDRPAQSPPASPSKTNRPIGQSASVPQPGLGKPAGDKRQSFRGSEISSPVLVSTTNRDSHVFSDFELDKSGIIARPVQHQHSFHGSRPSSEDGGRSPVRRTLSDRPLSPRLGGKTETAQGFPFRPLPAEPMVEGFTPRPLPTEPVLEDEPLYMNEELSDLGDLKAHITNAFGGLYLNVPSNESGTAHPPPLPSKPSPPFRPVAADAGKPTPVAAATSLEETNSSAGTPSKRSGPPRPSQGPHVHLSGPAHSGSNPGAVNPLPKTPVKTASSNKSSSSVSSSPLSNNTSATSKKHPSFSSTAANKGPGRSGPAPGQPGTSRTPVSKGAGKASPSSTDNTDHTTSTSTHSATPSESSKQQTAPSSKSFDPRSVFTKPGLVPTNKGDSSAVKKSPGTTRPGVRAPQPSTPSTSPAATPRQSKVSRGQGSGARTNSPASGQGTPVMSGRREEGGDHEKDSGGDRPLVPPKPGSDKPVRSFKF